MGVNPASRFKDAYLVMSVIKANGQSYSVRDAWCIGRSCLELGCYERKASVIGTGANVEPEFCCLTMAERGCPRWLLQYDINLAYARKFQLKLKVSLPKLGREERRI